VTAVELTPEEKKRIYEEEKARLEAEEKHVSGPGGQAEESGTNLDPNVAALLCYLGWWVTGIIFFVLERRNLEVRFHAAQSLVFFGFITALSVFLGFIPVIGNVLSVIVTIIGFIFWIVLMVKGYQGEHYMLPVAGEIAERMAAPSPDYYDRPAPPPPPPAPEDPTASPSPAAAAVPTRHEARLADREARRYRRERQDARIAGGAIAIAFLIAIFIVLNFFYQYIGYLNIQAGNEIVPQSIFTGEISRWLPYLNAALVIGVIGQLFLMFVDNTLARRSARIVMNALGFIAVIALLVIYPFDFSVIPDTTTAFWTPIGVTAILVFIAVVIGITLIVRLVQVLVHVGRTLMGSDNLD
jgi:uncharacterized membrane protein